MDTAEQKAYRSYSDDPFIVPRSMSYLFERHSLEERLEMNDDTLCCWLRSVEGAMNQQEISEAGLSCNAAAFFPTHHTFIDRLYTEDSDDSIFSVSDWEPD
jgi:hypothetical protein